MNDLELGIVVFVVGMLLILCYVTFAFYQSTEACRDVGMTLANNQEDAPSGYAHCVTVENGTLNNRYVKR